MNISFLLYRLSHRDIIEERSRGIHALFPIFGAKNRASAVTAIDLYGHLFPFGAGGLNRKFGFKFHSDLEPWCNQLGREQHI